jgi:hypothetical protein
MMAGGGFTVLIPPLPKNPKQTKDWKLSIRFTVISWEAQPRKSQLGASLAAEVLRDQRHVAEIFKSSSKDGLPRNTEEITASI